MSSSKSLVLLPSTMLFISCNSVFLGFWAKDRMTGPNAVGALLFRRRPCRYGTPRPLGRDARTRQFPPAQLRLGVWRWPRGSAGQQHGLPQRLRGRAPPRTGWISDGIVGVDDERGLDLASFEVDVDHCLAWDLGGVTWRPCPPQLRGVRCQRGRRDDTMWMFGTHGTWLRRGIPRWCHKGADDQQNGSRSEGVAEELEKL